MGPGYPRMDVRATLAQLKQGGSHLSAPSVVSGLATAKMVWTFPAEATDAAPANLTNRERLRSPERPTISRFSATGVLHWVRARA
jgi:hypothetical protein